MTADAPQAEQTLPADVVDRLRDHLRRLYPAEDSQPLLDRLRDLVHRNLPALEAWKRPPTLFDHTDVVVITYGDQISEPGRRPLESLREFLAERTRGIVSGIHILPFFPATSDDGFAVADFEHVDPRLGDWEDVEAIAHDFRLMVDAVFNHVSASNPWFQGWLAGDPRYDDFFIEVERDANIQTVTRPRPSPLLTEFRGSSGEARHVWTTFSPDQVDLNYRNPEVLLTVTEVLLDYLAHGAGIIRLDAVAFLWKRVGTSCIHLQETHEVIRLWRTLVDAIAPGVLLITETNVPHTENVSYFGDGANEAHLVYQFPLAPLVLSAFHLADASTLQEWAAGLGTPSDSTAFLNFLGSHDGVGLRPAEGLLTSAEIQQLCDLARSHGGGVSWKTNPDGSLSPYEINSVFFDALTEVDSSEPVSVQVDRFLAAQSVLLALAGMPAIYVQALLGSRNWHDGVERTGRLRSINREKFDRAALERELDTPGTFRNQVFTRMLERIATRVAEPAFHPNASQRMMTTQPAILAFERRSPDGERAVLCIHNLSGREQPLRLAGDQLTVRGSLSDLCSGLQCTVGDDGTLDDRIPPYGVRWLLSDPRA